MGTYTITIWVVSFGAGALFVSIRAGRWVAPAVDEWRMRTRAAARWQRAARWAWAAVVVVSAGVVVLVAWPLVSLWITRRERFDAGLERLADDEREAELFEEVRRARRLEPPIHG